jgi:hypothetical protein
MNIKKIILFFFLLFSTIVVNAQTLTYSFTDPCTQQVTNFSFPLQQGQSTVIFFLGKQRTFTASDVASGAFGTWINQVYSDYRMVMPCSVQSTTVVRNQIITQVIGNTVQSVMGSIMSSVRSEASSNDAASKGKTQSDKKQKKSKNGNSNSNNSNSVSNSSTDGTVQSNGGNTSGSNSTVGNDTKTNQSGSNGDVNNTSGNGGSSSTTSTGNEKTTEKGNEVVGAVTMNVDARNDKGNGGGGKSSQKSNPVIVSSDYTNAQNLDRSYTGIINIGMSQSSLTGTSSWGVTSMTWFNLKQFAISGRYTMIHFSGNGKLKFIHNLNLTGVYTYGNFMGFVGYSGILNAGKWGVTGVNISAAGTKISEDGNIFLSPSFTGFYTRPFMIGDRLTVSPEIYVISTPLVYSSLEKMTVTDRTFSGFLGSGFDYQITKRFKININYKANLSTNPEFPILSFFLIGSKVNL